MDYFEEYNGVEFRENNDDDPRVKSVSMYGDIQSKAAHEELVQASQNLLPLADYIEQNFSPDNSNPNNEVNGVDEKWYVKIPSYCIIKATFKIHSLMKSSYDICLFLFSVRLFKEDRHCYKEENI